MGEIQVSNPKDRCPFCRDHVRSNDSQYVCSKCLTRHHQECWNQSGGCAVFGCGCGNFLLQPGQAPPTSDPYPLGHSPGAGRPQTAAKAMVAAGAILVLALGAAVFLIIPKGSGPTRPSTSRSTPPTTLTIPSSKTTSTTTTRIHIGPSSPLLKACDPLCASLRACVLRLPKETRPAWFTTDVNSGRAICLALCVSARQAPQTHSDIQQKFRGLLGQCKLRLN